MTFCQTAQPHESICRVRDMNRQNGYCFHEEKSALNSTVNRMVAGSSPAQGASFPQQFQRLGAARTARILPVILPLEEVGRWVK